VWGIFVCFYEPNQYVHTLSHGRNS